jgi:hypothetical protein
MKYILSNRQRKELLDRAAPIQIAVPIPPVSAHDWTAWAKTALQADVAPYVQSAESRMILVEPYLNLTGDLANLGAVLGDIITDAPSAKFFQYQMQVVVIHLSPAHPRNRGSGKIQWPADVEIDGKMLIGR